MARRELATPVGMLAALTLAVPVTIVAYAGRVAPATQADQIVGLRFTDLDIPRDARIVSAWVEFDADEPTARTAFLTIHARAVDDAPAIATARGGELGPFTLTAVEWSPWARLAGAAVGHADRTPDLAPLFQEVVSRPGWSPGNAVVLVFSRSGGAEAFEGGRSRAPLLHVEFRRQPAGGSPRVELGRPTRLG